MGCRFQGRNEDYVEFIQARKPKGKEQIHLRTKDVRRKAFTTTIESKLARSIQTYTRTG
jgi:hypothetical protein